MAKRNLPINVPHLTIEDRTLYFTLIDGQWWIALKPIVEALDLEWTNYLKTLKSDEILGQLWCELTMVAGDRKPRMMVCLPERYIYGWLFGLKSRNKKLVAFKRTCYDALWAHFHGITIERQQFAKEVASLRIEAQMIRERLASNPDYLRLKDIIHVLGRPSDPFGQHRLGHAPLFADTLHSLSDMHRHRAKAQAGIGDYDVIHSTG